MQNLIEELKKRNHDQSVDTPGYFQAEKGASCFERQKKISTDSPELIKGPGKDNQGFATTMESSELSDKTSRDTRSKVDVSLGTISGNILI